MLRYEQYMRFSGRCGIILRICPTHKKTLEITLGFKRSKHKLFWSTRLMAAVQVHPWPMVATDCRPMPLVILVLLHLVQKNHQ